MSRFIGLAAALSFFVSIPAFSQTIEWTVRSPDVTSNPLQSVYWTGDGYFAGGNNGTLLASTDGETWEEKDLPVIVTTAINAFASTGTRLVGVGGFVGSVITSSDGETWTVLPPGQAANATLMDVVWTGSQLVVVGGGGTIQTSPDGETWTSRATGTTTELRSIAWTGSLFVVVGGFGGIWTSPDGETWTAQSSGTTTTPYYSIVWNGTQLVAVGNGGGVLSSPDGETWTRYSTSTSSQLNGVTWTGTQFVAVGGGGATVTSPDGETWTQEASAEGTLTDVIWTGTQLVAVGSGGGIYTSPADGTALSVSPRQHARSTTLDFRAAGRGIAFAAPTGAVAARVSVLDMRGKTVWSGRVGGNSSEWFWDGRSASGATAAPGTYAVRMIPLNKDGAAMTPVAGKIVLGL